MAWNECKTSTKTRLYRIILLWTVKVTHSCPTLCNPMDCLWDSPGQNTGLGSLSLLQGIFPTQGSNPGPLHCRWILYQLNHKGSPRILEWVAYPFSSRSSWPRNQTGMSCIASGFFTNWAIRVLSFVSPVISDLPVPSSFTAISAQSRCFLLPAENLSLGAGLSSTVRLVVKTLALPQNPSVLQLEFSSVERGDVMLSLPGYHGD